MTLKLFYKNQNKKIKLYKLKKKILKNQNLW